MLNPYVTISEFPLEQVIFISYEFSSFEKVDLEPLVSPATYKMGQVLGRVESTHQFKKCEKTATDGSQLPMAVLTHDVSEVTGIVSGIITYVGNLDAEKIIYSASFTFEEIKELLRKTGIYLK